MTKTNLVNEYVKLEKELKEIDWVSNPTIALNLKWSLHEKLNNIYDSLTKNEKELLPHN